LVKFLVHFLPVKIYLVHLQHISKKKSPFNRHCEKYTEHYSYITQMENQGPRSVKKVTKKNLNLDIWQNRIGQKYRL